MSIWKLYRFEDQFLAPSMVIAEGGNYIETEPIFSVSADDKSELIDLIKDLIKSQPQQAKDNDIYKESIECKNYEPALLEILGLHKWKDFEQRALMYTLHKQGEELHLHITGRGSDGFWSISDSSSKIYQFENPKTPEEIADEIIPRLPVTPPKLLGLGPGPDSRQNSP
ncbi:MAG: hypothetical protein K2X27_19480 [Candidatus Obscuribacterales bacterium]|nr:hypothetical protein [Candidatus Obscuribacterales bacterium]